ncbi:MAG: hypothetical protein HC913_15045 [Microscillaceae bacterium]|nr:hypothetical protein [Microscillaceae bacterium]
MGLLIGGIVLLAIGGLLYFFSQKASDKALEMKYQETSKVADVVSTYNDIKDSLGVGNYSGSIVELSGVGSSPTPLTAEHSQTPALYYEASVVREYEVTEQEKDNEGNYRSVTKRKSETVSSNSQYLVFNLDDGSGANIAVDMNKAKKDLVKSFDRFEADAPAGFRLNIGNTGSKTIGYRYLEKIIPNNAKLYVLGELSDKSGTLMVVKPSDSKKPFIVTTKSEEELVRSAESAASGQKIAAIVAAVLGVALMIAQFIF